MIFSKNKYSCGIILSLSATTISLIGTFIVYRMLWTGVAITQFAFWFSFLELSQLFLLADVGFTQDFIRNAVRQNADFNRELATVRGKLFGIGSLSVGVLVILFYIKTYTCNQYAIFFR